MKLQQLTIKNLASIEEARIDFEQQPLADEPLFLICGETGAGKTTLLDAICLALYNCTPRLMKPGSGSKSEQEMYTGDTRQLMRRNTVEACAELRFTGSDEIAYTARWYVERAYKKSRKDGKVKAVVWTLENHDTGTMLSDKEEVKTAIEHAIGLNFDQFCRTTLLAQGDFARFLQSNDNDKSTILEKLTGTGIYSQIGKKIFDLCADKKREWEEQKAQMEGIVLLTPEEITAIDAQMVRQGEETDRQTHRKEEAHRKRTLLTDKAKCQNALNQHEQAWTVRKEQIESTDFKEKEQRIKAWGETAEVRQQGRELDARRKEEQTEQAEEQTLLHNRQTLLGGNVWLHEWLARQQQELSEVEVYLQQSAPCADMFAQSQSIVTRLKSMRSSAEKIEQFDRKRCHLQTQLPALEAEYANRTNDLTTQQQLVQAKQEEVATLRKRYQEMQPDRLQIRKRSLEQEKETLLATQKSREIALLKKRTLDEARNEAQGIARQLADCHAQAAPLQVRLDSCRQAYTGMETLYNKQKDSVDKFAQAIRAKLTTGDRCPVCNQVITALPTNEAFLAQLTPIREETERRKSDYDQAEQMLHANRALGKSYEEALARSQKRTEQAQTEYNRATNDLRSRYAACHIDPNDEEGICLTAHGDTNRKELKAIDEKIEEADRLNRQLNRLQQDKDRQQQKLTSILNRQTEAERARSKLRQEMTQTEALIANERNSIQEQSVQLETQIVWTDWQRSWAEAPDHLINRLATEANRYQSQQSRRQELLRLIDRSKQEETIIAAAEQVIRQTFPDRQTVPADALAIQEVNNLAIAWNNLATKSASLKQRRQITRQSLADLKRKVADFLQTHPLIGEADIRRLDGYSNTQIEQLRSEQQALRTAETAAWSVFQQTRNELERQRAQCMDIPPEETIETLDEQAQEAETIINRCHQEIGSLQARLAGNRENERRIRDEKIRTDRLYDSYKEWHRLSTLFGSADGQKFRNIAQSFVLRELLNGANSYLKRLTHRYTLLCQAGSLTILLSDLYQGGATRPTSTLSGGESFIVSLSLALGLSSLNRQSLSVDTLFIDEGFGTLSSDYLNMVMDTLERLHQLGGKKVGIISHVDGLRERIKTQIQVKRIDNSHSEVKIVSEM